MEISEHTAIYNKEFIESLTRQKKELIESLNYAKNIQKAILPPYDKINHLFPDSFVFFQPKDIVSGDFYWFRKIDDEILFIVGDCTGHGVPGAFMSILGVIFLNEITNHTPLLPASRILNALRERIMKTLNQTGKDHEQKDGIDLSLGIYNENTKTLQFAGANNSIYQIRNRKIHQIKGDKMPIGISGFNEETFTTKNIHIKAGDRIYLFTDGYVDQFGGTKNKKFSIKRFRELLLDIHEYDFKTQREKLKKVLNNWKGEEEQVDDILIMGIGF